MKGGAKEFSVATWCVKKRHAQGKSLFTAPFNKMRYRNMGSEHIQTVGPSYFPAFQVAILSQHYLEILGSEFWTFYMQIICSNAPKPSKHCYSFCANEKTEKNGEAPPTISTRGILLYFPHYGSLTTTLCYNKG